jgi:hypothetical protein
MLVKIIEKMDRPLYFLKVRRNGCNRQDAHDKFVGPFYNEDEVGKYFKNDPYFDLKYFKKHKSHRYLDCVYELDTFSL